MSSFISCSNNHNVVFSLFRVYYGKYKINLHLPLKLITMALILSDEAVYDSKFYKTNKFSTKRK